VRWLGLRDEFWIYAGATMATMLLGGLWHGAAWPFVLWGAYQGLLLVGFRAWRVAGGRRRAGRRRSRSPVAAGLGVLAMFHLTCAGWLVFRAESVGQILDLAGAVFLRFDPSWAVIAADGLRIVFYVAPLLAVHAFEARHDDLAVVFRWPPAVRYAVYVALAYFILLFGDYAGAQFIYFQF